jgi:integrase
VRVLSFEQAQRKAGGARRSRSSPITVNDVIDDYIKMLEREGRPRRSVQDTIYRANAFIRPALGKLGVGALTTERLRNWRDDVAELPARQRTRAGAEQNYRRPHDDADRKRRVSANRLWAILRAALNHAFHDDKIESDMAWRKVKPFKGVGAARIRYLTLAESKRLINACDREFRALVQAALFTGARYGELARLRAQDFNSDAGTVFIEKSKSGKARHVILTDEGRALFRDLTIGKPGDALILTRTGGQPWGESNQLYRMAQAVKRAKIVPTVTFHGLRHSYASLSVMNGLPLQVLAQNLGHVDTRMCEAHYAHLAPSYMADTIRKHAPSFGYKPDTKVATIR